MPIQIPLRPIRNGSFRIPSADGPFSSWSSQDHAEAFDSLKKISTYWKEKGKTEEFIAYGKQNVGEKGFSWEIVPVFSGRKIFHAFSEQLKVLSRITFGGVSMTPEQMQKKQGELEEIVQMPLPNAQVLKEEELCSNDAFCRDEVIAKQSVKEGLFNHVLYSYAPLGSGKEKLHFLIVPRKHRTSFHELTKEEYVEACELANRLTAHFFQTRPVQEVHLFHKTGKTAGQNVPHWHLHVVLTSGTFGTLLGKLSMIKNMVIGSFPLKDPELKAKVKRFRWELLHT